MRNPGELTRSLVDLGYRLTPQRMMVLEAIENSQNHISAEEIYARVVERYPNVNISTVYRTMELLKRLGLVTETDLGGGRLRYHPAHKGRHHHLVCQHCGRIIDLDEATLNSLRDALRKEYDFEPDIKHMAIFGACARCRQKKS